MSKLTDMISDMVRKKVEVRVYIPGSGYVLGKLTKFDDDMVTIAPVDGATVVLHFTHISVERD